MTTNYMIGLQSGAIYHTKHDESLEYRMALMCALWSSVEVPKVIQDKAEENYYKYKKEWLDLVN